MSSSNHWSEVSMAYNKHVANLDQARQIFEKEVENLNQFVHKHLEVRRTWPSEGVKKVRWSRPQPWSSARGVQWLNWVAGTRVRMDIKPPSLKIFRKAAAFVFFQTIFEPEMGRFAFECRLENQNSVNSDLDEATFRAIQKQDGSMFPHAEHIKRNTTVVFRCDIEDGLFDNVNDWVDRGLKTISDAVDVIFPDEEYASAFGEEMLEEEDVEDEEEDQE